MTLVPLLLYFNARGIAKIELALARGRRKYEKREAIKEREWRREKGRLIRQDQR
jgi:SsrA-binding protein